MGVGLLMTWKVFLQDKGMSSLTEWPKLFLLILKLMVYKCVLISNAPKAHYTHAGVFLVGFGLFFVWLLFFF